MENYTYGVVTVSDSCSNGSAIDTSGIHLERLIKENFKTEKTHYLVIPDDESKIESTLLYFSDVLGLNAIFTTGGTGFSARDVTPEATRKVITKEAPQLALAMSLVSFEKTKFAALSRAVCGIRGHTLIVNLPGSRKAVEECFLAITSVIPHAIQIIVNDLTCVKDTHRKVQQTTHIPHVCPHKTGTGGGFDRNSTYPMIDVEIATSKVYQTIESIFPSKKHKIISTINIPPFRASIKDGYAVRSSDGPGLKKVIKYISAGDEISNLELGIGECFKINTGAPVPNSADAIVQLEDTKLIEESDEVEKLIEILVVPTAGLDIRPIGSDLTIGETLIDDYPPFDLADESVLASAGGKLPTLKNISISIIATGDELIQPGEELKSGQIYDSNTTMLRGLLKKFGFELKLAINSKDSRAELKKSINKAMEVSDVVICTGGVSMGDKDFVKPVLKDLNFEIIFGRVNMKPGKPMTYAFQAKEKKFFFGLPGNPVSAFVTFHLFVLPALRAMKGFKMDKRKLPIIEVELLNESINLDSRPEYARATIILKRGKLYAEVTGNQISSRLQSIAGAGVLLELPSGTNEKTTVKRGSILKAHVLKHDFISKYDL